MSSQVSARALDVVDEIATRWGEDLGNGIIRIRRPQAILAEDLGCSAGTIAWYLSHAGDTVRRDGTDILVDRAVTPPTPPPSKWTSTDEVANALIRHFGRPAEGQATELLDNNDRPPTTRAMAIALSRHHSTIQAHLERLESQGRLTRLGRRIFLPSALSTAATPHSPTDARRTPSRGGEAPNAGMGTYVDTSLIETLSHAVALLADAANTLSVLAQRYTTGPRPVGIQIAENRGMSADTANFGGTRVVEVDGYQSKPDELPTATSLSDLNQATRNAPATATDPPTPRRRPPTAATSPQPDDPPGGLDDQALDEALAPLLEACDKYRLPAIIDRRGRDTLRRQDPAALEAAVAETIRLARSGGLKAPLGFLVSRAVEDPAWFDQALRSRRRAASRNKSDGRAQLDRDSYKTNETQMAEGRWLAEVLDETQLARMVTQYRARHPRKGDPLSASMAPLITQAARDSVQAHPDLDPVRAVTDNIEAHFQVRLDKLATGGPDTGETPVPAAQLPQRENGPHLASRLRQLDK